ncbi:MAG TPA: hypothetical protein VND88_14535 [Candidatus Acidoferrales bacterium]|nr:hypothetical protein [Candidatus Acidoferrales bacterium]
MSDESSRSARPSGQRRNDGAPSWWAALERADLPSDDGVPAAHRRWYEDDESATPFAEGAEPRPVTRRIKREWIPSTLVALAVGLMLVVALGVWDSADDALTVTTLIGVPLVLAVITTLVVARRTR